MINTIKNSGYGLLLLWCWLITTPASAEQAQLNYAKNSLIGYFAENGHFSEDKQPNSIYYRKFIKANANGSYVVQDFYVSNDNKQVDPITLLDASDISNWNISRMDGQFIQWYPNGNKKYQSTYKKGIEQESIQAWHSNGQLEYQMAVKGKNKQYTTFKQWNLQGDLLIQGEYKNGKKHGLWTYWQQSNPKQKNKEVNFVQDKIEGTYRVWGANGVLREEITFHDGQHHGSYKTWYRSGKLEKHTIYKQHRREGLDQYYYESGQLRSTVNYHNGEIDGEAKFFFKNGQLNIEKNYKNGRLEGVQREYNAYGTKIVEGYNKNNDKQGKWYYWDSQGLRFIRYYEDGYYRWEKRAFSLKGL